jgi:hypothetical protein
VFVREGEALPETPLGPAGNFVLVACVAETVLCSADGEGASLWSVEDRCVEGAETTVFAGACGGDLSVSQTRNCMSPSADSTHLCRCSSGCLPRGRLLFQERGVSEELKIWLNLAEVTVQGVDLTRVPKLVDPRAFP